MIISLLAAAAAMLLVLFGVSRVPLGYNLRNLSLRWKTTLMTALAFTAVIGLLTVMMAFVHGMRRVTEGTGRPENVIVLSDGATDEIISNLMVDDLAEIENLPEVARDGGRPISSRETFLVASQPVADDDGRPRRRYLQVRGIEDARLTAWLHDLDLLPGGRWFSEAGVEQPSAGQVAKGPSHGHSWPVGQVGNLPHGERPRGDLPQAGPAAPMIQAVLGDGIARELARGRRPAERAAAKNRERLDVGDTFTLRERTWIVVGILNSSGVTFNSEIWAKRSIVASLFGKETYTTLVLRAADAASARRLADFLAKDYKKAAVNPQLETEYYQGLSESSAEFAYIIAFLAVVMSVGGIFGVMNTICTF